MKLPRNRGDASTILLIAVLLIGFLLVGQYLATYLPEWSGETVDLETESPSGGETSQPEEVSFTTLLKGSNGGLDERGALVVRDKDEWARLKKQLGSGIIENKSIDFDNDIVLAAFFGQKNTGGYIIRIEKVENSGDLTTVTIRETSPSPNCVVTEGLTTPYHIVTISKTGDQIKFVSVEDTVSCN